MKTLIVPTDFSPVSLNAANYAADMAHAIGADLILLHVIQIPVSVAEMPLSEMTYEEMIRQAEKEIQNLKDKLAWRTSGKINITADVSAGSIGFQLQELCKRKKPFAVVMGTQGAGAVERFFIGSNTLTAVHTIPYPVLVVPEQAVFKEIKKIAWACDLKDADEPFPLDNLKELMSIFNASLDILNVESGGHKMTKDSATQSVSLQNLLAGFHPRFHFISEESVEDGINKFTEENLPDLLLVIPKKHGFFESLFRRSQSKKIVLHPHTPVMTIHE